MSVVKRPPTMRDAVVKVNPNFLRWPTGCRTARLVIRRFRLYFSMMKNPFEFRLSKVKVMIV